MFEPLSFGPPTRPDRDSSTGYEPPIFFNQRAHKLTTVRNILTHRELLVNSGRFAIFPNKKIEINNTPPKYLQYFFVKKKKKTDITQHEISNNLHKKKTQERKKNKTVVDVLVSTRSKAKKKRREKDNTSPRTCK